MTLPKFNEKLFDKVIDHILEEPKRLDMDSFAYTVYEITALGSKAPSCGTVACFGGWAVALSKRWDAKRLSEQYGMIPDLAGDALGLTSLERYVLFYPNHWPARWTEKLYDHKQGSKAYAKVLANFATEFKAAIKANRKEAKE